MITEIIRFKTDDGTVHDTLQAAKDHENREDMIRFVMSNADVDDRYTAGSIIDALNRSFTLVPKE